MRHLGKFLRHLKLADNVLILIKKGSGYDNKETLDQWIEAMQGLGLHGLIAVVNNFDDIQVLSEPEMNKAGWFRAPMLQKLNLLKEKPEPDENLASD